MNCLICLFIGVDMKKVISVTLIGLHLRYPCVNDLQLPRCSQRSCFRFCAFGFEGLLLVWVACTEICNAWLILCQIHSLSLKLKVIHNIILQCCSCEITEKLVCRWLQIQKETSILGGHHKYMCSLFANTLKCCVKFFLHHHQKMLKHFLLKCCAVI